MEGEVIEKEIGKSCKKEERKGERRDRRREVEERERGGELFLG